MDDPEGTRLDPADWQAFRENVGDLLAASIDRLERAREFPWILPPEDLAARVTLKDARDGVGEGAVFEAIRRDIMPYATGNTHPGFFGWVHGTGSAVGMAAQMAAAAMNANCGGRNHGAGTVEVAVIDWLCRLAGLPETAFGLMTSGTSQATILALNAARFRLFGADVRAKGIRALPEVAVYAAEGAHTCISNALEVMGHGANALRLIPTLPGGGMDVSLLEAALQGDKAAGIMPMAVVATAGSVNTGVFDAIEDVATLCEAHGIWLHVDAAFGFWTLLADAPWCDLPKGIGRAQSVALDFHKWFGAPYAAGACLIHDREVHRATFAARPEYLAQGQGLAGGSPWFTDYGIELSRGFSALMVWAMVKAIGTDAIGASVTDNCKQAQLMGDLVAATPRLSLAHPVVSNLCCFYIPGDADAVAARLQLSGAAVFSTTKIGGKTCLRAAIVNHRTTSNDIRAAIQAVKAALH